MPKFPTIPRLTIVVPHFGETESFESSLVSVLQHRPDDCEVLVPHSGSYDDPFDLSDEVKFVDAGSPDLVQQIAAAANVARGRFVHVVADGHLATSSWTEPALAEFEYSEAGVVVPVVRVADDSKQIATSEVLHAGWSRTGASVCQLIASGATEVTPRQCLRVEGGFLSASFWRRDLLRSLSGAFLGEDIVEASLVYGLLCKRAKWRCVVSRESTLFASDLECAFAASDYETRVRCNQRRLQAIADGIGNGGGWSKSLGRFMTTCLGSGLRPAIGRAMAPLAVKAVGPLVQPTGVLRADEQAETLRIPVSGLAEQRRAA
ncbi:glycosyltransferase family 2 protein [Neorhodopirellula pilleata]|uniref:Glycosyl transferase family 2 n=1 Tax=Neorhodopirellula pilleata TaxID=2714738 RepID=A0A5C5ZY91_9BACT|nr:glycosyltransferase family 2 protein [Neorhodopirellula pilleata]TWT92259.1 hypothetical protein Pla100_47960 [Neorhodopirellula pilleata]